MRGFTRIVQSTGVVCGVFVGNLSWAQSIEQISLPAFAASMPHNGDSYRPVASDDGRWVAYLSAASNLVEGDDNGLADFFRKDLHSGAIARIALLGAVFAPGTTSLSGDGNSIWRWLAGRV